MNFPCAGDYCHTVWERDTAGCLSAIAEHMFGVSHGKRLATLRVEDELNIQDSREFPYRPGIPA
jgi:hypothetical protein